MAGFHVDISGIAISPLGKAFESDDGYLAGLLDSALSVRFLHSKSNVRPVVEWTTNAEQNMDFLRQRFQITQLVVKAVGRDGVRCVATFVGESEREALKIVASGGAINRDVALAVLGWVKGELPADVVEHKVAEVTAQVVQTTEAQRVVKRSLDAAMNAAKLGRAVPKRVVVASEEIASVRDRLTLCYVAGVLENAATWSVGPNERLKVVLSLAGAPAGLRVVAGVRDVLGVGKVSAAGKPKLVFGPKDLSVLKDLLGEHLRFELRDVLA